MGHVAALARRHLVLLRRVRFGTVQQERILGRVGTGVVVAAPALAAHHRVLDAVAAVDEFKLSVARKSQLQRDVLQRPQTQFNFKFIKCFQSSVLEGRFNINLELKFQLPNLT